MKKILLTTSAILLGIGIGFSQSITLSPTGSNGRQGIGIETPGTQLEVGIQSSGNGINISGIGGGFKSARLSFWSDRLHGNEWRPGFIQSGDNSGFTGRLDFYTNGTGVANKIGAQRVMSIANGGVGIGVIDPLKPLHVKGGDVLFEDTTPFLEFRNTGDAGTNGIKFASSTGLQKGLITYTPLTSLNGLIHIQEGTGSNNGLFLIDGPGTANSGNNIGINEDDPRGRLHIRSNSQPTNPSILIEENNNGTVDAMTFENSSTSEKWHIKYQSNDVAKNANFIINATNSGDVVTYTGDGNAKNHGFTQLGDDAPKIKMKKLSGSTAGTVASTIAHGLTGSKILGVDILIESNFNSTRYPANSLSSATHNYTYRVDATSIYLDDLGSNLQNADYTMLITYEE